jgi:hypothetical protein
MKKIKMNKTKIKYVTALAMTPLVFVGTITTSTILMSNNLLRARSLPTKVTLQSILGASKAITHVFETTPSAADIMD